MQLGQNRHPCEPVVDRRTLLACAAASISAGVAFWGHVSAVDAPSRSWLSVGEIVGRDDKASELARRLANVLVEVRGYEFANQAGTGDLDLLHRFPVPCGGCGMIHSPGPTLPVVGAGRGPLMLGRSTWAGRLRIVEDGRVALVAEHGGRLS